MKHLIALLTLIFSLTGCFEFDSSTFSESETGSEEGSEESSTGTGTAGSGSSESESGSGEGSSGESDTGESSDGSVDMGTDEGYCGDGLLNGDEECDGTDFGTETCTSQDPVYTSGELSCDSECRISTVFCDVSMCEEQPMDGEYSPCQTSAGNGETCGSPDLYCLALWAPHQEGFCGRTCQQHSDCDNELYDGCGAQKAGATCAIPTGEAQGRCVVRCDVDQDCPTGMACWGTDVFGSFMKICK